MAISVETSGHASRLIAADKPSIVQYLVFSPVIELTSMYMYYIRDCFAGFFRYILQNLGANSLWFLPDVMAFLCVALFVIRYIFIGKNLIASLMVIWIMLSFIIAYFFFRDVLAVASGLKMIVPLFVGFCFCMRPVNEMKSIRYLFYLVFIFSCIGIVWNSYGPLAWEGFAYEGLGVGERDAGRQWWIAGGVPRLGGFAADSTMAGFFLMAGYAVLAVNMKIVMRVAVGVVAIYVTYISTSKTSLLATLLIFGILCVSWIFGKRKELKFLQAIARYSYLTILIPYVLIVLLNGVDLTDISSTLFSMQDRINRSWVLPIVYMADLFPPGFVTGCGAGCFNYPMQLFPTAVQDYFVPVDNFYYGSYLMFGIPFLLFLFRHCITQRATDPAVTISTIAMNFFAITILCYGPASSLLLFGIIYSGNFSSKIWGRHVEEYHGAVVKPPKRDLSPIHPLKRIRWRVA